VIDYFKDRLLCQKVNCSTVLPRRRGMDRIQVEKKPHIFVVF